MRFLRIFALLAASLALAACADQGAGRFGAGSGGQGAAGAGLGGIDSAGLGSAADPSSPAYFNNTVGDRVFFVATVAFICGGFSVFRWSTTGFEKNACTEGGCAVEKKFPSPDVWLYHVPFVASRSLK